MIRALRALGATLLVAVLLSGCGADEKAAEKAAEKILSRDGSDVDIDGEKITVKDKDGNAMSFGEGVELPDDFPAEIPLPQGDYKINSVMSQGGETTLMFVFKASDMESLEEHIRSGLTGAGYTIEDGVRMDSEAGKQVHFSASSAEREVGIMLMVTPQDEGSAVYSVKKADG